MRVADAVLVLTAAVAIIAGRPAWDGQASGSITVSPIGGDAPTCAESFVGWRDATGTERPWTEPASLRSNGALLACPPRDGTMRFDLMGSAALGRHAHALVVAGGTTAFDGEVVNRSRMTLDVSERTPVLIAFVNDLYRSPEEDRDLWIGPVDFTTP